MSTIAADLAQLLELATRVSHLPRLELLNSENWQAERNGIAREIARAVGRLRKELGIAAPAATSFAAATKDTGIAGICRGGRVIRVERRKPR